MTIRSLEERDRPWARGVVREHFGSSRIVTRGVLHETHALPGLVAEGDGIPVGLLQYRIEDGSAEIVVLIAVARRRGVGSSLLRAFRRLGDTAGFRRMWLITTNDNRSAQALFEAVGMRRCAVYTDAVAEARRLKPELPTHGEAGVPILDEIEFEWPPVE